ncbi:MAG: hypothetical protein ABR69_12060 [OM182 bacterium BACL3 MAG-120507-bin80]|jgi:hypothetical protein|uniref:Flagellar hook-length control protein-like C-terminal domain-containing protein n=1 Tax=OM182 bacterium BACL3 MAG-120507-bin80 TaxID=1655577 RepID=A0A0R2S913_9GAMM|nr:MAG: hypothetical protein ABR69_12060 [OM182 bacterium BACL3 MAG-120507-bin80]
MISTHFDLQNIIKEMESTGNGAESSVNATGSEFSATITRVLESLPHDIESETELVDSLKAGGDESLESGKKDDGEHESGNVLPLMLSQPPSFDQLTLGGKRPILIGKLNAEQRSGISQSEATESTYALSTTQKLQDLLNSTQRLGGSGEASKPLMERLAPVGQTSITQAALANRTVPEGEGSNLSRFDKAPVGQTSITQAALANGTVPEGEGSNLSRFDKAPDRSDSLHFKFAESSKGQIEAVKASSEQIHFSKNLDRLNSVGSKFERAELAASGNGKKDGSVDSASANQQQSVLNSFTPRSALRQLQAFKGLSNEQAAPLADVQSIEVSSLKNTTQSEASIDSAMAKFDVDRFNEEVGKIVKNQLVNSFTGKNISVKMLLSPESLGQVEVDLLFSKDSEIQITLRTENAEVAKLMQANATVLRDQLAIEHKGIVALNINDSRTAEFGFQGNQRDEANREKYSVFDESDSGESNNALEKSSISGDGSNSLIDTFA